MGRKKGFSSGETPATMPRRLAAEGERRQRTVKGGNALCQWVAATLAPCKGCEGTGPAGTPPTNLATARWLEHWLGGLAPWRPVCETEELAYDRRSIVHVGEIRVNNGRGSMLFDAVVKDRVGKPVPVSLKGGDTAKDVALGASLVLVQRLVEAGAPIWVARLTGGGHFVGVRFPYETGVQTNIPAPDPSTVKVEWFNLTPMLAEMPAWDRECASPSGHARIRAEERECKAGEGQVGLKTYLRLNVTLENPAYVQTDISAGLTLPGVGWWNE